MICPRLLVILLQLGLALPVLAQSYFVAPTGGDGNPGTLEKPFATIGRAQQAVRQKPGPVWLRGGIAIRSEEHTSELQSLRHLVCRLLLEKKKKKETTSTQKVPLNYTMFIRHTDQELISPQDYTHNNPPTCDHSNKCIKSTIQISTQRCTV